MKVFINIGLHPRYKETINYPPRGIKYDIKGISAASLYYSDRSRSAIKGTPNSLSYYPKSLHRFRIDKSYLIKTVGNNVIKITGLPRLSYYYTSADLIFSTRGIIPLNIKPWVVEIEHPYAFVGLNYKNWGWRQKFWIKHLLEQNRCKKVITITSGAREALENGIHSQIIKNKIETVFVTVHYEKIKKVKHTGITLLTATNWVYDRGFNIIKEIYPRLKKKYPDINWTIKTIFNLLPEDQKFVEKYDIKILRGVYSQEQMNALYAESDIFLYPTFVDPNPNVSLEAMRAGLPIVGTDMFGLKDKIIPHYNGLTIHDPGVFWDKNNFRTGEVNLIKYRNKRMSEELYKNLDYLISHKKERLNMDRNSEIMIKTGPFSMERRNRKLKRIFEEAVKR